MFELRLMLKQQKYYQIRIMNSQTKIPFTLEEKFQLYKLKQQKKPICDQNELSIVPFSNLEASEYIVSEPNSEKVFQMLLGDPTLRELSQNLKKQAEEKNKQCLLGSFPERYQNLLEKEKLLINLEEKVKSIEECHQQKVQKMMEKLKYQDKLIREKEKENLEQCRRNEAIQRKLQSELSDLVIQKERQILYSKQKIQLLQNKCEKYKDEYSRASAVLVELRQLEFQHESEEKRLINSIKQLEDKLTFFQKKIIENEEEYKIKYSSFQLKLENEKEKNDQLSKSLTYYIEQFRKKMEEKEATLDEMNEEKYNIIQRHEQEEKEKHQQIQQIRMQYLESLQTIDMLEQKNQQLFNKKYQCQRLLQEQIEEKKRLIETIQKLNDQREHSNMKFQDQNSFFVVELEKYEKIKVQRDEMLIKHQNFQDQMRKINQKNEELLKEKQSIQKRIKEVQQKNKEDFEKISQHIKEHLEKSSTQISQLKEQNKLLKINIEELSEKNHKSQKKVTETSVEFESDKELEQFVEYYFTRIEKQEQDYLSMKQKIQNWIRSKSENDVIVQRIKNKEMIELMKNSQKDLDQTLRQAQKKIYKQQTLIERLKKEIKAQCQRFYDQSEKERRMFEEVIRQNKMLKRQIHF